MISREQLLRTGFTEAAVDELVRARHLRPVHHGVYGVGHRALSVDGRRLAALLACGDAALSHRTAAAVLGYVDDAGPLDVTVVDDVHHERPALRIHRSKTLDARDVMTLRKLTLTRPARTLMDLAAVDVSAAWRAADKALRSGCTPAALRDVLDRHRYQPGRRSMVRYLATRRAKAVKVRSELERLAAELILGSDLPRPQFNPVVALRDSTLELDVWWTEGRVVLELDGREYHEGVVPELEDARREAVLRDAGQRVLRAAWWDVTREPGRLLSRLEHLLADRP